MSPLKMSSSRIRITFWKFVTFYRHYDVIFCVWTMCDVLIAIEGAAAVHRHFKSLWEWRCTSKTVWTSTTPLKVHKISEKELRLSRFFNAYNWMMTEMFHCLLSYIIITTYHKSSIWDFHSTESRSMAHFSHDSSAFSTSIEVLLHKIQKIYIVVGDLVSMFCLFSSTIRKLLRLAFEID